MSTASSRPHRLVIELPHRVQQALAAGAAAHGQVPSEYAGQLLCEALAVVESEAAPLDAVISGDDIAQLFEVRDRIMNGRQLETDSSEILRQSREERAAEQLRQ